MNFDILWTDTFIRSDIMPQIGELAQIFINLAVALSEIVTDTGFNQLKNK